MKRGRLVGIAEERAKAGGGVLMGSQEIHLVSQLKPVRLQALVELPAAV